MRPRDIGRPLSPGGRCVALFAFAALISASPPVFGPVLADEIKAQDCSIAVKGTTAFSQQTIYCLSDEQIGRVVDELVKRKVILRAEDVGLGIATVRTLARRLKPTQQLDDLQAAVEVSAAVASRSRSCGRAPRVPTTRWLTKRYTGSPSGPKPMTLSARQGRPKKGWRNGRKKKRNGRLSPRRGA